MNAIELRKPAGCPSVPDKPGWEKTFEIKSETSNSKYRIARNKDSGQWGCSCIGYCLKKAGKPRGCKHLKSMGLTPQQIHGNDRLTGQPNLKQLD